MAGLNFLSSNTSSPQSSSGRALGVMVGSQSLYGALLERETSTQLVRRLSRQRGGDYAAGGMPEPEPPGMAENDVTEDFTLQIGNGNGAEMFLGSEFGDLGSSGFGNNAASTPTFALELEDMVDECHGLGYTDAPLAFCLPATDVHMVELLLPDAKPDKPASEKKLIQVLEARYDGVIEKGRVAFLPMTPQGEGARYLALVGQATDSVIASLTTLAEERTGKDVPAELLDNEISLYFGLARSQARAAMRATDDGDAGRTLLVRVGGQDALVLFLDGEVLEHAEVVRSLTAFDAAETVCSRVLLLQDEYGIGEVDRVLLVGQEQEASLADSFATFFPDADVDLLRKYVPGGTDDQSDATLLVPAVAAALRMVGHRTINAFEPINLLPSNLFKKRVSFNFSWHIPALYALLFIVAAFFVLRYFTMERKISEAEEQLQQYPVEDVDTSPRVVQARIDSLEQVYQGYVHGLSVVDSLLAGNDQWGRALAGLAREAAAVRGVWVESWDIGAGPNQVVLEGNSTSRDRVVRLAERLDGNIQEVTFSEIREWPVYSFRVVMPLYTGLPEAAKYLRQQLAEAEASQAPADPVRPAADGSAALNDEQPPAASVALREEEP